MNKVYVIMWCNNASIWTDYKERIVDICNTRQTAKNHIKKYEEKLLQNEKEYNNFFISDFVLNDYNYNFL